jgi:hypothetical protein
MMIPTLIVHGRYTNRTFVPDEPLPAEEGTAELVIHPNSFGGTAEKPVPRFIHDPQPSYDEFVRLLEELAAGPRLPHLPPDFSREDIYDDHD